MAAARCAGPRAGRSVSILNGIAAAATRRASRTSADGVRMIGLPTKPFVILRGAAAAPPAIARAGLEHRQPGQRIRAELGAISFRTKGDVALDESQLPLPHPKRLRTSPGRCCPIFLAATYGSGQPSRAGGGSRQLNSSFRRHPDIYAFEGDPLRQHRRREVMEGGTQAAGQVGIAP